MSTTTTTTAINGNTYPVRQALRALGGRWDAAQRVWLVPAERAKEARALVAAAPHAPYSPRTCIACGARESRDARGYPRVIIYRSGECRDCFEERKMGY
jgi:hypothetical protein